jgi:PIN domain
VRLSGAATPAVGTLQAPSMTSEERPGGSIAHGIAAGRLPRHHEDPFDRMLIAQALAEGLTIVTRDKRFDDYGVPVLSA